MRCGPRVGSADRTGLASVTIVWRPFTSTSCQSVSPNGPCGCCREAHDSSHRSTGHGPHGLNHTTTIRLCTEISGQASPPPARPTWPPTRRAARARGAGPAPLGGQLVAAGAPLSATKPAARSSRSRSFRTLEEIAPQACCSSRKRGHAGVRPRSSHSRAAPSACRAGRAAPSRRARCVSRGRGARQRRPVFGFAALKLEATLSISCFDFEEERLANATRVHRPASRPAAAVHAGDRGVPAPLDAPGSAPSRWRCSARSTSTRSSPRGCGRSARASSVTGWLAARARADDPAHVRARGRRVRVGRARGRVRAAVGLTDEQIAASVLGSPRTRRGSARPRPDRARGRAARHRDRLGRAVGGAGGAVQRASSCSSCS